MDSANNKPQLNRKLLGWDSGKLAREQNAAATVAAGHSATTRAGFGDSEYWQPNGPGTKLQGIADSGKRMTFASGSMRDPSEGKIKWSRITFGPMMRRWAQHLTTAEAKYPDPKPGLPNFMLIETVEEYHRYRESAFRHFMDWFDGKTDEDHASATFFNINGVEIIKAKWGLGAPKAA
jgi:hypothetical protein